jgi:hypothetical protein
LSSDEVQAQLARLDERSTDLTEDQALPRGALPALFRALAAAEPAARLAALPALVGRLADWPLVEPTLALVAAHDLSEALCASLPAPDEGGAFVCAQQAAILARLLGPAEALRALEALRVDDPPEVLSVLGGDVPAGDALVELLRARLSAPARRRGRTSTRFTSAALHALRELPPRAGLAQLLVRLVHVETRRAGTGEPTLALDALDTLAEQEPFEVLRLLHPLLARIARRKVCTRGEEVLAACEEALGLTPTERTDLLARTADADAEGWVEIDLEEGGVARVRIDAAGEILREAPPDLCAADRRALNAASKGLRAAWDDLAQRLEQALMGQRAWAPRLWRTLFLGSHPLWSDLATRLVWEQVGEGEALRFSVEGGELRDLFAEPCELTPEGAIRLCHVTELDADELELWREHALARPRRSPFPQLFRSTAPPEPDVAERFVGREVHRLEIDAAAQRYGWEGTPLQGTGPWEVFRATSEGTLRLGLSPVAIAFKATLAQRRSAHRRAREGEKAVVRRHRETNPRAQVTSLELNGSTVFRAEGVRALELVSDPLATPDSMWLRAWQSRKWKEPAESWREAVLRYRQGSPSTLELRRALLVAFAQRLGLELRLEDRFAITAAVVIELGTGLCHEGPPKDHLPQWKIDERLADLPPLELPWPFRPSSDELTVEIVERVLQLAQADLEDEERSPE